MEPAEAFGARQIAGHKDFWQHAWATRVVAGRDLRPSAG